MGPLEKPFLTQSCSDISAPHLQFGGIIYIYIYIYIYRERERERDTHTHARARAL